MPHWCCGSADVRDSLCFTTQRQLRAREPMRCKRARLHPKTQLQAVPDEHIAATRREALFGALSLISVVGTAVWPQVIQEFAGTRCQQRYIQPVNRFGGSVQSARSFSLPQSLDFSHLLQPEPVAFPRKILDQRFAVLLLRSTYDAVDALDFIAMVSHEL